LSICNLEGPVVREATPVKPAPKAGPHLLNKSLPMAQGMTCLLTLANNHLMDYGETGLCETMSVLASREIAGTGAGIDARDAAQPCLIEHDGVRYGVLARCEVQFGIATDRRPGVAAFDATLYRAIRDLKRECDVVIASIHAAAEMCPWPSPRRQDTWRALVEAGADVVHGHHAHVPQGWERHEQGLIFYGLGNLCVDPQVWSRAPNALWSLVPELTRVGGKIAMHPTTAVIDDLGTRVRVREATPEEADLHRYYLASCNRPLAERALLEGLWQEVSVRMYQAYYADWLGFEHKGGPRSQGFWQGARRFLGQARAAVRRTFSWNCPTTISQGQYLLWYHLFACDSHNDAIATALGVLGGSLDDLRTPETVRMVDEMMPSM
jgi:poly-gamma-glutamate synthesis protein (capsule biosynthesis protein)